MVVLWLVWVIALLVFAGLTVLSQQASKLVRPERRVASCTPESVGIAVWENVEFLTRDGLMLRGWFVPPALDAPINAPVDTGGASVVCAHGTGAHRGVLLPQAALLHRAGYGVLLFDFRAHGVSDGRVSSFGFHEIHDLHASVAYLRSRADVDAARIAVLGHSMGGATALRAAARGLGVRALVVISAVSSLRDNLLRGVQRYTRYPALGSLIVRLAENQARARVARLRPVDDLQRLGSLPVLLVYGERDRFVPLENGQSLYAARPQDTTLLLVPGAGHRSVLSQTALVQYQAPLLEFFEQHLTRAATPNPEAQPLERARMQLKKGDRREQFALE